MLLAVIAACLKMSLPWQYLIGALVPDYPDEYLVQTKRINFYINALFDGEIGD